MGIGRNRRQLEVIERALRARQLDIGARKRLPRGVSVGDLVDELALLEMMLGDCASLLAAIPHSADCTGGNGVDIGPKLPAIG